MKLVHQINLAFGLLLVAVLGFTAVMIHYVLMDHFISSQKDQLRTLGTSMASSMSVRTFNAPMPPTTLVAGKPVDAAYSWTMTSAAPAGVHVILSDSQGNVLQRNDSNAPDGAIVVKNATLAASTVTKSGEAGGYIVDVNKVPQGTLTLLTPVSKIKAIEQALFGRLLIVLGAGGALALLFSLLITRKLIRPLMRLREELKKVRERKFGEVGLVKAGGEIGAVAQTVYELAEELERHNRAQKQFFQNASHELKTPLMSIAGYAEGIRDGVFEGEGSRKGLDIILSESGRLKKIVTEMTLLAKLDSEEDIFHPSAVHVREVVTETIERINPILAAKGLELQTVYKDESQAELYVKADRDKLLQALLNIVSNATRYANGTIVIEIGVAEGGRVTLTVADDGKGFPDSLLPHLFHRFVKGKDGETGLGLAISRAIVERCGGRIAARNRPAGGALISLSLPSA
ncbi:sensor histidine kinase [Paenibacillus sacheonensis]|uniref:histidine kinase n=1 Tax=Paenibacillus sacheonensis TaxID=742054 RepID=A0A7X4YRK8_9BACL|nr:HAMP domain-containing sensor histidine kinase [Paenibacillus sacheonensis]MBM7567625.1 signal transduction histidine kinase [Paenibacillus sacheonensis]NBC71272.1 sensor histidine kinase [Paenibacillus sacheonensis]